MIILGAVTLMHRKANDHKYSHMHVRLISLILIEPLELPVITFNKHHSYM